MERKVALITGSSGFIGSHLVKHLKNLQFQVVPYDIEDGYDILDLEQLRSTFKKQKITKNDVVYHLAAQAFIGPGEENPYRDIDINIKGTINVLKCVEEYGPKFLMTSSGAVYGLTDSFPHAENALIFPTANYGCSKRAAELYVQKWSTMHGITGRIVRFSSVYGPRRGMYGPVNVFLSKALKNEPLTIFGDGSQTRDLTYIEDACRGMDIVMRQGVAGEIYNIGLGKEHSILEVAEIIAGLTGAKITFIKGHEFSKFDVTRSYYNIEKARAIGYEPLTSLRKGIKLTYQVYK
jgi:UDP-glucose 4-epimerase